MKIITVDNLQKQFKVRQHHRGRWAGMKNLITREHQIIEAVNRVSFDVDAGELVGYLGPNGAGKSTTIKMLTGLLVPTSGDIQVNGYVPWRDRQTYVSRIGAVFGQRTTLWWDLPVIESLELLQFMYRVPPKQFRRTLDDFNDLLELSPFLNSPVRSLSLGQRMRADICAALLHRPDLLFLDEPTIGLDVVAKERIRQFIRHVNRDWGTTILLTTHDLADVQKLCDRVMIIDQGRLLYNGDLNALQARFGGKRELVVDFAERYDSVDVEGAEVLERQNGHVTYQFEQKEISASDLIGRVSARYRIQDLAVREPDIETTVRRIYEERLLT